MKRRKFSREFKVEAVKLVRQRGVSVAQASRDLDVHENVLRKWVKGFGSDPVQAYSRRKRHEVRLHREAPDDLTGGMAMRCAGGIAVGLPCLAEPHSQRQIPQR